MKIDSSLFIKYNVPVPRYTSYPTVPFWKETIDKKSWETVFIQQFSQSQEKEGISLYLHLPFCESLCTYCGCNKKITSNHAVEEEYIQTLLREWAIYTQLMQEKPLIRELHLGGGTPTFFSPNNLARVLDRIFSTSIIHPQSEYSFEGHPNNTTRQHLETLFGLGFRRVSFGVQDNDPEVQRIINRIQPVEQVRAVTEMARETGFKSINFDLIYGLPLQNRQRMEKTILQSFDMKPDRIAFYSYAHVPWTSKGQRLFDEKDLPAAEEKIKLYQLGRQLLMENGFHDIGMDHFSLPTDDLFISRKQGTLHRNFMGYTTQRTAMLLGLGVSSISDIGVAFAQNEKTLHNYNASINSNELAIKKGCFLSEEDLAFRQYIKDISCKGFTTFNPVHLPLLKEFCFPVLEQLANDGLVEYDKTQIKLTMPGHYFIRNICSAFDLYLQRDDSFLNKQKFSKGI